VSSRAVATTGSAGPRWPAPGREPGTARPSGRCCGLGARANGRLASAAAGTVACGTVVRLARAGRRAAETDGSAEGCGARVAAATRARTGCDSLVPEGPPACAARSTRDPCSGAMRVLLGACRGTTAEWTTARGRLGVAALVPTGAATRGRATARGLTTGAVADTSVGPAARTGSATTAGAGAGAVGAAEATGAMGGAGTSPVVGSGSVTGGGADDGTAAGGAGGSRCGKNPTGSR